MSALSLIDNHLFCKKSAAAAEVLDEIDGMLGTRRYLPLPRVDTAHAFCQAVRCVGGMVSWPKGKHTAVWSGKGQRSSSTTPRVQTSAVILMCTRSVRNVG